jgi:uncharacterized protein YneF (UPF0154 family)
MRHILLIPLALLVGLIAGSWVPRNELKKAELRVKELEQQLADARPSNTRLRSFTDMITSSARAADPAPSTGEVVEAAVPADSNTVAEAGEGAGTNRVQRGPWGDGSLREELDRAAELWRTRADVARNSLVATAGLKDADAARFDVLMEAMNVRLGTTFSNWADRIKSQKTFTAEDGARMFHELSGAFVVTYDELGRTMPTGWRDAAGSRFDLTTFVDPAVATPLIGVEDSLRDGFQSRRGRRGR